MLKEEGDPVRCCRRAIDAETAVTPLIPTAYPNMTAVRTRGAINLGLKSFSNWSRWAPSHIRTLSLSDLVVPKINSIRTNRDTLALGWAHVFELSMTTIDPSQYDEADPREVDPPVEVETATWSAAGRLDWWVRERREWFGQVRGPDGRQRWAKASDVRPAES